MAKRSIESHIFSTPLQDSVPVTYKVVGTPAWLKGAWEEGALASDRIVVAQGSDPVAELRDFLWELRMFGFDTETSGPYKAGYKRYSMTPWNEGTKMALAQMGTENLVYLVEPDLLSEIKDIMESDEILKAGHNLGYDFKWTLVKYKIHLVRMYCSMLAEQLLTAGLPAMKVGLADSVRRREPFWLINKAVRDHFIHLGHDHGCPECVSGLNKKMTAEMAYYAGKDIVLLFPLFREQIKLLKHWKMEGVASDEFEAIPAVCEMEIKGVNLAVPMIKQIIAYWLRRDREVGADILKIYDTEIKKKGLASELLFPEMDVVFNLKSNAAKLKALREMDINLEDIKRDSLKLVAKNEKIPEAQRKIAKLMAEYSNIVKRTSTYGQNMLDRINEFTKLWHPEFHQMGSGEMENRRSDSGDTTATGRMSSDAQQFPRPQQLFDVVSVDSEEFQLVSGELADAILAAKATAAEEALKKAKAA
jgi:DNA polymerase I-like protein with 3'-5' exonuclease and polymerase domains